MNPIKHPRLGRIKFFYVLFFFLPTTGHALPDRVVTLAPNLAEWIFEIAGPVEAAKHLIGVSEYSDYPAEAKQIERIGPYPKVNVEKILSLKPTLILALKDSNDEQQLKQLERLHLKVVRMPQEQFFMMGQWLQELGKALGENTKTTGVINRWKNELQKLSLKASKGKAGKGKLFVEVQDEPLVTVGGPSFLTDAFKLLGYDNIFKNLNQGYPKVSRESVLSSNPDFIFILDLSGHEDDFEKARNRWRTFKTLNASTHDRIRFLKGDDFGRCSFRLLSALKNLI